MNTPRTTIALAIALATALFATQAWAVPMQVDHIDTPGCDVLSIPVDVHEIGSYIEFPPEESLDAFDLGTTNVIPCRG